MSKIKKAIIKATGKEIEVYQNSVHHDKYVDYSDCKTMYDEKELIFK